MAILVIGETQSSNGSPHCAQLIEIVFPAQAGTQGPQILGLTQAYSPPFKTIQIDEGQNYSTESCFMFSGRGSCCNAGQASEQRTNFFRNLIR